MNASFAGIGTVAMLVLMSCTHHKSTPDGGGVLPPVAFVNPPGIEPTLRLGVNENEILPGFPLIYSIDVFHPDDSTAKLLGQTLAPIVIAAQTGSWAQFVTFSVRDQNGAIQKWPLHLIQTPGSTLSLDATNSGTLMLVAGPTDTASLPPGKYQLDVWLDSRVGTTDASWKGVATDSAFTVVDAPPANLSPFQQCWKAANVADYYDQIKNDVATAIATLDQINAAQPNQNLCLLKRAMLAERAGDICTAQGLYRQVVVLDEALALAPDAGIEEPSWIPMKLNALTRLWPDGGCPGL